MFSKQQPGLSCFSFRGFKYSDRLLCCLSQTSLSISEVVYSVSSLSVFVPLTLKNTFFYSISDHFRYLCFHLLIYKVRCFGVNCKQNIRCPVKH